MASYAFAQRATSYLPLPVSPTPVCLRTTLMVVISKDYQQTQHFVYIIEFSLVFLVFVGYFILFGPLFDYFFCLVII